MNTASLSGVIVPVITPVDDNECVDERAFRRSIRRLLDAGVHAIFVGGSAGEGPLLTSSEWERMATIAADEVNGTAPLLGGAIDTSTRRVIEKIRVFSSLDFLYSVVTPTYYITLRAEEEYLRLFGECAAVAAGMEIIAYNIPACVGSVIPTSALFTAGDRGWIKYVKESSGDYTYFKRLVDEGRDHNLSILEGEEGHIAQGMLAGAVGIVPVCANFEPETFIAAYEAGIAGDADALVPLQERILLLRKKLLLVSPLWIAGIKYAMSCMGLGSGKTVSPLCPLTVAEQQNIRKFVMVNQPATPLSSEVDRLEQTA
ncbi:MAG: dihydrodipicolinate synthase family protein [Caldilineales bacterium]|nr:dihydrodipicolinate synthase family protein [Caldilineales bacterium]